jgi:molybdenum cofactor cytidylyltransferase
MTNPSIAIIILAAGASRRMRLPKQLLPYKRKGLLQHTIDEATKSKAASVFFVLGANATEIQKSIRSERAHLVLNEAWPEGMSSSIRAGIAALPDSVDAAIISLCDQPLLCSSVFDGLIDTFVSSGRSIVASEYAGSPGVPVLFARKHFPEIAALHGDLGARTIIEAHRENAALVPFTGGSVDIDTPDDYKKFILRNLEG